MIDITTEQVLSLTDAALLLPARRRGRPTHPGTLYRWATSGVRGVRLETLRVGGTLCTSPAALQRFCEALTAGAASLHAATADREEALP